MTTLLCAIRRIIRLTPDYGGTWYFHVIMQSARTHAVNRNRRKADTGSRGGLGKARNGAAFFFIVDIKFEKETLL